MKSVKVDIADNGSELLFTEVASTWNEIDAKVYASICGILMGKASRYDKGATICTLLFHKNARKLITQLDAESQYGLLQLVNFLFEDSGPTKNLIPEIKLDVFGINKLYGPSDLLKNVSFGEWIYADEYFTQFCKTNDIAFLDKLIAVLYRHYSFKNTRTKEDKRSDFNETKINISSVAIARLKPAIKFAVFFFFAGCKQAISTRFPHVFVKKTSSKPEGTGGSWLDVYDELLGTKFGTQKELTATNIYTIFLSLERASINADKK